MRPVTPDTLTAKFWEDRPLLLLDKGLFGIRYLGYAITTKSVGSKCGLALPLELWLKILGSVRRDREQDFCYVRAISIKDCSLGRVLFCGLSNLVDGPDCFSLDDTAQVRAFEHFLASPDSASSDSFPNLKVNQTDAATAAFSILLDCSVDNSKLLPACLFSEVAVPDVIAHLEGGRCIVCCEQRDICPGCTRGVAQRYDAFMGCGVGLACPLCMGLDFMLADKAFLQKYHWDEAPKEEEAVRQSKIDRRLSELGYR
ncbi:MAG: hypothetical protein Q9187_006431 [Circinaria calcarea]